MTTIIKPTPPSLSHAGVALYSGFTGISGNSFGGIIFGGTIKMGGLFGIGVGTGLGSIFGIGADLDSIFGAGGSGGTKVIGVCGALYIVS